MSNDKMKPEPKRGMPGGFFLFLVGIVLLILTIQNLTSEKNAKVSFSYQLEHLVNLDLVQPDENRKIALNDNLVTFSGRFKDKLSEQSKTRYRFLELLEKNHELAADQLHVQDELAALKLTVMESVDLFLHLSGIPIPQQGYQVIDPVYFTGVSQYAVVINKLSPRQMISLQDLKQQLPTLSASDEAKMGAFNKDLLQLIEGFRSTTLGISNQTMKDTLKNLDQTVRSSDPKDRLAVYGKSLQALDGIVTGLNKEVNGVRLLDLRTVRNYKMDWTNSSSLRMNWIKIASNLINPVKLLLIQSGTLTTKKYQHAL